MQTARLLILVIGVLLSVSPLHAAETTVSSTVRSVGLFKNGVVVVQEEIDVPGSGRFLLKQVPVSIHGTFFLESNAVVETRVTQRDVTEPLDDGQPLDFQKDFAGQQVKIYFNSEKAEPVVGRVVNVPQADLNHPQAQMPGRFQNGARSDLAVITPMQRAAWRGLILDTDAGRTYLTDASFYRIDTEKVIDTVQRKRTAMVFDVKSNGPAKIRLFYLTKGITWAPSYRIDITDPRKLTLEQTAVVVNELRELKDTEVSLISGFPKIECENVTSPLSPSSSLSTFFQQLSQRSHRNRESMLTQQAIMSNTIMITPSLPDSAVVGMAGEGPDIHLQTIGKRSMGIGDVLSFSNGKATADYERIVEWSIPDNRDAWGRYHDTYRDRDARHPQDTDHPWDMLRFRNPLPFPMTTAPATIISNQQFFGQNVSFWANPKEMTQIPVTKSMSVRVNATEFERMGQANQSAQPKTVERYGHRYREAIIDVALTMVNRRAEPVKMIVKRGFSGELEKEINGATVRVLNEDLGAVNRKHEIQWEFELPSGETKKLTYAYVVLIRV